MSIKSIKVKLVENYKLNEQSIASLNDAIEQVNDAGINNIAGIQILDLESVLDSLTLSGLRQLAAASKNKRLRKSIPEFNEALTKLCSTNYTYIDVAGPADPIYYVKCSDNNEIEKYSIVAGKGGLLSQIYDIFEETGYTMPAIAGVLGVGGYAAAGLTAFPPVAVGLAAIAAGLGPLFGYMAQSRIDEEFEFLVNNSIVKQDSYDPKLARQMKAVASGANFKQKVETAVADAEEEQKDKIPSAGVKTPVSKTAARGRCRGYFARGCKGSKVEIIQRNIKKTNLPIEVDGDYGGETAKRVRDFQNFAVEQNYLPAQLPSGKSSIDGIYGPMTHAAMEKYLPLRNKQAENPFSASIPASPAKGGRRASKNNPARAAKTPDLGEIDTEKLEENFNRRLSILNKKVTDRLLK